MPRRRFHPRADSVVLVVAPHPRDAAAASGRSRAAETMTTLPPVPDAGRRRFLATWFGRSSPGETASAAVSPGIPRTRGAEVGASSTRPVTQVPPLGSRLPVPPLPPPGTPAALDRVAIVQGRHCLAYQRSFCSTCLERCPVPHAIIRRDGLPMVNATACTGCGLCQEACPAPTNAILLLPRRKSP